MKTINILLLTTAMVIEGCRPTSPLLNTASPTTPAITNTAIPYPTKTATLVPETVTPSPTPGLTPFTDDDIQIQIDRLAAKFLKETRNPGLSVAIIKRNPQTNQFEAMLRNFGTTAKVGGKPVNANTIYEIGSITKVFTGILLAEAVNAGKMKLDDPIQIYMPSGVQAPIYRGIPITLAGLVTHRSGLPRDLNSDSLPYLYAWLNSYHLNQAPGADYIYSNLGYELLGDILARNANNDYASTVFQSVSRPLGLMDTTEILSDNQTNRLAEGYSYDGSPAAYFPEAGAMSAAGYLHSTLDDLTRFVIENMRPEYTPLGADLILAQTSLAEGRNPGTGTGLGWDIDHPGQTDERIYKGGTSPGFSSYISFNKSGASGFILLTNGRSNGQFIDSLELSMISLTNAGN